MSMSNGPAISKINGMMPSASGEPSRGISTRRYRGIALSILSSMFVVPDTSRARTRPRGGTAVEVPNAHRRVHRHDVGRQLCDADNFCPIQLLVQLLEMALIATECHPALAYEFPQSSHVIFCDKNLAPSDRRRSLTSHS